MNANSPSDTDDNPGQPDRAVALERENARLREVLARHGIDADKALAENAASPVGASAPNDDLQRSNAALQASQAALIESQGRLNGLFAMTTVGVIFWGPDFTVTGANGAFLAMTGFSPEEARGLSWQQLTPEEFHPTSLHAIEELMTAGESTPYEKQYFRKDGSRWWGLFAARKVEHETVEVVLDVTDRRQAQEALRESEERMRLIVEGARDYAIFTTDPQGRISQWSSGAAAVFGWNAEEAVGCSVDIIFTPEDRRARQPEKEMALARTHGIAPDVRWHLRRDGTRVFIDGRMSALRGPHGELRGFLKIGQDITERRAAEDQLQQSEAALRHLTETLEAQVDARTAELRRAVEALHAEAREHAQAEEALRQAQKMEAVGQLTGGIAHDFNNLLAGIIGSLDLMHTRVAQGRYNDLGRYLTAARGAADRAAALTHRLLAFSRQKTLDPKPTNLNELVHGMAELLRRTIGPHITMEVIGAPALWTARCDTNQQENALLNLCINARDAMVEGGRLVIETGNVQLDVDQANALDVPAGPYVCLRVTDTGSGMPPDVIARAFDPFYTTKPQGQGTGLGLSMVYGFARQSGGQVHIDSTPGHGTSVAIYLPRYEGPAEIDAPHDRTATAPEAEAGATGVVLVVDDEPTVRILVGEVLRECGYTTLEAGDASTGLRVLQSLAPVDLLVTDIGLPGGIDGRQLADRARLTRPALKVLFITGYADSARLGTLEPGMQVMAKPFSLDALASRIGDMLEGGARQGTG
ncbi:PAS domain S-box protein [Rhodanobacter umsongensis]|uniref:histidine kinase n=1 Tax=Rhodanobacter umsongensis TaxID=633153 RepID=A0ABW0JN81_9GAMM